MLLLLLAADLSLARLLQQEHFRAGNQQIFAAKLRGFLFLGGVGLLLLQGVAVTVGFLVRLLLLLNQCFAKFGSRAWLQTGLGFELHGLPRLQEEVQVVLLLLRWMEWVL